MNNLISFMFLGTLGWGVSLFLIKILLISLSPIEIVLYRMTIGAFALFGLVFLLKLKINNLKNLLSVSSMLAIFNITIPFYLTTLAERSVSTSLASILNGMTPIFTFAVGLSWSLGKLPVNFTQILSMSIGLLGLIIINADISPLQGDRNDIMALIFACTSYALAANYLKRKSHTESYILVSAVAASISALIMLITKLVVDGLHPFHLPASEGAYVALLWLGMIGSGMCIYLYCVIIKSLGAETAAMVTYLMTLTGVVVGLIWLNETMSMMTCCGCFFIAISLLLTHVKQLKQIFSQWRQAFKIA